MKNTQVIVVSIALLLGAYACSAPDEVVDSVCNPNGIIPDDPCKGPIHADAGVDADADTDVSSNPNAIDNPGLDTSDWAPPRNCITGNCLPVPVGSEAGLWENVPISLWIGPADQVPAACPNDPQYGVPNEKFRLFDQLDAPPATCSQCSCGPSDGTCNGVPETLELRAGTCAQNGVMTVPFDSPANWDGSCTNANAIAAGAKCPTGSQTLCTQSVHSSALPLPANEACQPSVNSPLFDVKTSWKIAALGCHGNTEAQSCGTDSLKMYCVNDPGPAWLQCTYREGVHDTCPDNYQYARHVLYPKEPIDNRGCSACECGAPMGSACMGSLSLFADGSCGVELVKNLIASTGDTCFDVQPPGIGFGSKRISNQSYLPGICSTSGGEAIGNATADATKAVTFCCMEPYIYLPPPR